MKSWSNIKKEDEEHVKRLLKQFPQLQYEIGSVAYQGMVPFYITGDVEIVNQYFRLYKMYVDYCGRRKNYLKKNIK